jgi:hypothetical protein
MSSESDSDLSDNEAQTIDQRHIQETESEAEAEEQSDANPVIDDQEFDNSEEKTWEDLVSAEIFLATCFCYCF